MKRIIPIRQLVANAFAPDTADAPPWSCPHSRHRPQTASAPSCGNWKKSITAR